MLSSFRRRSIIILLLALMTACRKNQALIAFIDPKIGNRGEVLTIYGSGFGAQRDDNYVKIAGIIPTASTYLDWTDSYISLTVPDFCDSGLVYVFIDDRPSNPALFSNLDSLPRMPLTAVDQTKPKILRAEPAQAAIGALVTISGQNFGSSQNGSTVQFSWEAFSQAAKSPTQNLPDVVDARTSDFAYEVWTDSLIKVRVPDGALTGSIYVRTAKDVSEPFPFAVIDKPGTKTITEKRSYAIVYSVSLEATSVAKPGTIYIWLPIPPTSATQRNVHLLSRSLEPFVESYRGVSLYQLNIEAPTTINISVNYLVDTYAIETQVKTAAIKHNLNSPLREKFTEPDALIPAQQAEIIAHSTKLLGRETNPYLQAKKIYDWIITEFSIDSTAPATSLTEALAANRSDVYGAVLLYCACLRAAGIPAIPLAGYLIDTSRKVWRHWWVEFWIDGLGWIPVDPALGAGAAPSEFSVRSDYQTFYFGNMDNQRIAFSRSLAELEAMDPHGKTISRDRAPAFQTFWEESTGGITAYSSLWNDISVTGIY